MQNLFTLEFAKRNEGYCDRENFAPIDSSGANRFPIMGDSVEKRKFCSDSPLRGQSIMRL